jgi:hypothetical protein
MTTDNQSFDLVAADGLRLSFTPIRDWTMLHPELRGTPFQLYAIMRSLVIEKGSNQSSRRLTLDHLCWLLPGVNGKPTSLTAVRDALKVLNHLGLVTNRDGERLVASTGRGGIESRRRFQVNDLPPEGFQGWRNAWDKLDNYREDWRVSPADPPAIGSTPARPKAAPNGLAHPFESRNSDTRTDQVEHGSSAGRFECRNSEDHARNSARDLRNSAFDHDLTSGNDLSNKSLKEASLSTVTTRPPEADPNEPREREDLGETNAPDPADPIVQAWIKSWAKTQSGAPHPVKAPDAIRRAARELLAEGKDRELLCLAAADMATHGWISLHKHLERWKPPAQPSSGTTRRTKDTCHWCDDHGWYETQNGNDVLCRHPEHPPPGHPDAQTRSAA